MRYSASFDLRDSRHGFGTLTFSASGEVDFEIDLSSLIATSLDGGTIGVSVFNHYGMNTFVAEDGSSSEAAGFGLSGTPFAGVITDAMQSAATWPSPSGLVCTFNDTFYTFNYFGSAFTQIAFSNGPTKRLFGFAGTVTDTLESITGTLLPNFLIDPVLSAVTMESADGYIYEPKGVSSAVASAAGMQYGLPRTKAPLFRNWVQQSEPRAKVIRGAATAAHPCTHQLLVESCRSVLPFAVIDGFGGDGEAQSYLFRLRPEGAMWSEQTCSRAGGEMDDAHFDVRYRAQQLGSFGYSL